MKRLVLLLPVILFAGGCAYPAPSYPGGFGGPYSMRPRTYGPQVNLGPLPIGRWDNVMMTAVGTPLFVLMMNGSTASGDVVSASVDTLRLHVASGEVELAASEVMRVDRMSGVGRNAVKDGARGAALGAGVVGVMALIAGQAPPARVFAAGAIIGAEQNLEATASGRGATTIYLARGAAPAGAAAGGQYAAPRGPARGPCAPGVSACNSQGRYQR
jgi:hypothetical protein